MRWTYGSLTAKATMAFSFLSRGICSIQIIATAMPKTINSIRRLMTSRAAQRVNWRSISGYSKPERFLNSPSQGIALRCMISMGAKSYTG